jgi:hypothetical protein
MLLLLQRFAVTNAAAVAEVFCHESWCFCCRDLLLRKLMQLLYIAKVCCCSIFLKVPSNFSLLRMVSIDLPRVVSFLVDFVSLSCVLFSCIVFYSFPVVLGRTLVCFRVACCLRGHPWRNLECFLSFVYIFSKICSALFNKANTYTGLYQYNIPQMINR